ATRQQAIEENYGDAALASLNEIGSRLGEDARTEVEGQGVPAADITVHQRAHIRYAGTDTALVVPSGSLVERKKSFETAHKARFGFVDETKQLVIEAVSVEAVGGGAKFSEPVQSTTTKPLPAPARRTRFYSGGRWHDAGVYTRDQLAPGHK